MALTEFDSMAWWRTRAHLYGVKGAHYLDPVKDRYAWRMRWRAFRRWVDLTSVQTCVDWGCGPGEWIVALSRLGVHVRAWDPIPVFRSFAAHRAPEAEIIADETGLQGDLLLCVTVLQHAIVTEPAVMVLQRHRRIAPRAVWIEYLPPAIPPHQRDLPYKRVLTWQDFHRCLEVAGWRVTQDRPVTWIDMAWVTWWDRWHGPRVGRQAVMTATRLSETCLAWALRAKYRLVEAVG